MAYDENLAQRVRTMLRRRKSVTEKKMFGGLAFMVQGHMCCGIVKNRLLVRVGPDQHESALAEPHAHPMDFTGKPMKGFIYVDPEGCKSDVALKRWIDRGVGYIKTLPPK
jgi:TfoX/Sxy family transcriptional regulator of competence genes